MHISAVLLETPLSLNLTVSLHTHLMERECGMEKSRVEANPAAAMSCISKAVRMARAADIDKVVGSHESTSGAQCEDYSQPYSSRAVSGWWAGPIANTRKGCNEFISCRLWKCSSPSRRHSDRVEAHKHKVQRVNPHRLTSPSLPSMASEHLFIGVREGDVRSSPAPSREDSTDLPTRPPLKTTCVVIFNLSGSRLYPWREHVFCFFFLGYQSRADRSASVHDVLVVNIGRSKTAHCDLLWIVVFHLWRVHFPWRLWSLLVRLCCPVSCPSMQCSLLPSVRFKTALMLTCHFNLVMGF